MFVYILKCSDGTFYTGSTSDVERRVAQHEHGEGSVYTRQRRPVELMFIQEFTSANDAVRAERQIKGWSRAKKEALIRGSFELLHDLSKCKNSSRHTEKP